MRHGTLGESEIDESVNSFDRNTQSSIRNPYDRPSTSRNGSQGPRIIHTARKSTSRQQNVSDSRPRGAARRKVNLRQRELKLLKEVMRLQRMTKLMIPKAPFSRLVREISFSFNAEIKCYTHTALEALQEATEMFISQVLTDAYLLTLHRKCVTLSRADMLLIRSLKFNI